MPSVVQLVQPFPWIARSARFAPHSKDENVIKFIAIPNISKTPENLLVCLSAPRAGDAFFISFSNKY
jgi:hypothetical protein